MLSLYLGLYSCDVIGMFNVINNPEKFTRKESRGIAPFVNMRNAFGGSVSFPTRICQSGEFITRQYGLNLYYDLFILYINYI